MKMYQSHFNRMVTLTWQNLIGSTRTVIICSALTIFSGTLAGAQSSDNGLAEFANSLPPSEISRVGQQPDQYLKTMTQFIYEISPNGIATREAAEVYIDRHLAVARTREISQLLQYDLDGDGDLTVSEIEIQMPYISGRDRAQLALWMLERDSNSDGTLSLAEILASARASVDQQSPRSRTLNIDSVMAFDFNADGGVDFAELTAVIGAIDPAYLEDIGNIPSRIVQSTTNCVAPIPEPGSEVVFISGYKGSAISTLAVSGQHTRTSVATATIVEGTTPLYIFVTATNSIVWKFDGATDRVRQLVVQPRKTDVGPGAAVAGIDSDKITFVAAESCIDKPMSQLTNRSEAELKLLSLYLGQSIDHVLLAYTLSNIQVPSKSSLLTSEETASTGREHPSYGATFSIGIRDYEFTAKGIELEDSGLNFSERGIGDQSMIMSLIQMMAGSYPAGIIDMAPEDVYAPESTEQYAVLPEHAGLLQLFAEGSLEGKDGVYIKEPILQFPAGVNGQYARRFTLAPGIPMPAGSPGNTLVFSEETGECLVGAAASCRERSR